RFPLLDSAVHPPPRITANGVLRRSYGRTWSRTVQVGLWFAKMRWIGIRRARLPAAEGGPRRGARASPSCSDARPRSAEQSGRGVEYARGIPRRSDSPRP